MLDKRLVTRSCGHEETVRSVYGDATEAGKECSECVRAHATPQHCERCAGCRRYLSTHSYNVTADGVRLCAECYAAVPAIDPHTGREHTLARDCWCNPTVSVARYNEDHDPTPD